jgi:hypothetical protein
MEEKAVPEQATRQIGFITKGGGMNLDAWIAKEKETTPNVIVKDFPTHIEFHLAEKIKK